MLTDKKILAHMEKREKELFEDLARLRKSIQVYKDEIEARRQANIRKLRRKKKS